jgi:hypothetical protein
MKFLSLSKILIFLLTLNFSILFCFDHEKQAAAGGVDIKFVEIQDEIDRMCYEMGNDKYVSHSVISLSRNPDLLKLVELCVISNRDLSEQELKILSVENVLELDRNAIIMACARASILIKRRDDILAFNNNHKAVYFLPDLENEDKRHEVVFETCLSRKAIDQEIKELFGIERFDEKESTQEIS